MYTPREERVVKAFRAGTTCCVTTCQCGRVHFVSCPGHGDYDDGELEELLESASENPDRYVESAEYDTINWCRFNGRDFVPDCPCGYGDKVAELLESQEAGILRYMILWLEYKRNAADIVSAEATNGLEPFTG